MGGWATAGGLCGERVLITVGDDYRSFVSGMPSIPGYQMSGTVTAMRSPNSVLVNLDAPYTGASYASGNMQAECGINQVKVMK